ncbi:hypothetical protein [Desulfoscipio gibsoniae]|uniref:Uncharacterized protein n=1 Tax=Desulfoscipio gibsoniae DSM 7213 TaxID=767817 RepID=R4KGK9_9FIRM|nr:hypothetical protein [Desulfoscipio gibsoniae]AGK99649.1 hypothetical protein Desgi_0029 [Desulfoscipio gibsoniae DSM 7213]
MEVSIIPQKKFECVAGRDYLKARITLIVSAKTKEEKRELRARWEQLEENGSLNELLELVREMEAGSYD